MKGALFDLDGVIFDTESQYSVFWGEQMRMYFPNEVGLENRIKGQTLVQIFDRFFPGMEQTQHDITQRLNEFEHNMSFVYVKGFEAFVQDLRSHGIKTAVVTSSNQAKMENVYRHHPEFISYFDRILTSEDFSKSKPDPDCYLKGASYLGTTPEECVGFEDSFNGLKAVKASGMKVVGLYTTNPREDILPYCDVVYPHYENVKYQDILQLFGK
ncbi:MAG: HAD family hydrolase [Prevotella sp.]|nr:HAD family hydrolase [Prevotella sp.]